MAALGRHYDVSSSIPVISWERDGTEQSFEKLDGVWQYTDDPEGFAAYIAAHIDARLPALDAAGDDA